ncbi:MAG: hypothetical protein IPL79_11885 [Myxococcales bacterium]|nr:hypothetical protein [Myxococcales bacterium]
MDVTGQTQLISTQLEVHDQRQLEIELDYHPSGTGPQTEYQIDTTLFIPRSLNVDEITWPREMFYRDLHNYVRLKTPSMAMDEIISKPASPLRQLEANPYFGDLPHRRDDFDAQHPDKLFEAQVAEMIYDAKMLGCVFRGALRGASRSLKRAVRAADAEAAGRIVDQTMAAVDDVSRRFRALVAAQAVPAGEGAASERFAHSQQRVATALRLVDEYMSLNIEEYLRRMVVHLANLPTQATIDDQRRKLMDMIVADEAHRKAQDLTSIIEPLGDNEEYTHRLSLLKKFCQNILFLRVQRTQHRKAWEEVFFAVAAGAAMAVALSITLAAHAQFQQVSFNFFLVAIVAYILRDRIKDGLRNFLYRHAGKYLYERSTRILDPLTHEVVGACQERVDYGADVKVPPVVRKLRSQDALVLAVQAELEESVIRYRKVIKLNSEILPRLGDGMTTGITDIIRLNVDRLLYDMDDPEYIIDYVDMEELTVERLRAAKSYRVDVAFRFAVNDGTSHVRATRLVQLVIDRNGIKRMHQGPWVAEP